MIMKFKYTIMICSYIFVTLLHFGLKIISMDSNDLFIRFCFSIAFLAQLFLGIVVPEVSSQLSVYGRCPKRCTTYGPENARKCVRISKTSLASAGHEQIEACIF